MKPKKIVEPDLLWHENRFRAGVQMEIHDDGTIGRIGPGLGKATERLTGEALLPGMVNAHSHAFQRGLRGRGERHASGSGTFWTWREEMYRLVDRLDAEGFEELSYLAFREMLSSGITTVGEFHYLHHLKGSSSYELDEVIVSAAHRAGIRLVLLDTCYLSGDVNGPLDETQKRFGSASVEGFLDSVERLQARLDLTTQSLGLVAHSIRAVPLEAVVEIHEESRSRGFVFHMHVEEQKREIESTRAAYGKGPLDLLLDRLEIGSELTAVHCTHSEGDPLRRLLEMGANICLCPLTEANLADGVPNEILAASQAPLCLGTDSNLRIDFFEEMRLLEYAQRLVLERRGVFENTEGRVAERLFEIATVGGARALNLRSGRLETGYPADFFTIDRKASFFEEVDDNDLLEALVFGAGASVVRRVAVGGDIKVALP